jgi:tetratricopeptide (TPR) repeat protein
MLASDDMRKVQLQREAFNALQAGQRQKAIRIYQTLLSILGPSDVKRRMLANWGLGSAYIALDRHAEALSAFEEVLQGLQSVPYPEMEAGCLASLAQAQAYLGQHQEAIAYCTRAISAYQRLHQPGEVARWMNNLGLSYEKLEHFEQARESYENALRAAHEAHARDLEASAMGNLGQLYLEDLGGVAEGMRYLETALALFRSLADSGGVAKTLANLGKAKMVYLGEVGAAIELFGEAQMLARFSDNEALLAHLNDLMHTAVSQLEPAEDDAFDDDTWGKKAAPTPMLKGSTASPEPDWAFLLSLGGSGEKTKSEE